MAKWLDYLLNLQKGDNTGICPYCGSSCLSAGFMIVDEETRLGHGALWCNDCKKAYIISRMTVNNNLPIIEKYPNG